MSRPPWGIMSVPHRTIDGSPDRDREMTVLPVPRVVVRKKELPVTVSDTSDTMAMHREDAGHPSVFAQTSISDLVDGDWIARSSLEGLNARELYSWPHESVDFDGGTLADSLSRSAEVVSTARYRRSGKTEVLARLDGALINVTFVPPHKMWVGVAARTREDASAVLDRVLEIFPERDSGGEDGPSIPLSVWTQAHAEPTRRTTEVSSWGDIADNYAPDTKDRLAALMDPAFEAGKGGKLVLLHGAPGTGKSTALATLAWQWREWSELHYIADPADFLSTPEYLIHVSLSRRRDENWRVVLLEDAGGLFSPDAKQASGEDRLGRLLNITDGMLGSASKALFIITTNEPLSSFHSAVSRPGRCAATVEFLPFSEVHAKKWLEQKGRPELAANLSGERTLAELYGLLEGSEVAAHPKRPIGFRVSD